ncbi:MAG: YidC/Oxa1 family membrane protein insertase [Candidatus Gracilibacteria bacterium]|jgi:YidC/Oxa1 family membrane protein insertase
MNKKTFLKDILTVLVIFLALNYVLSFFSKGDQTPTVKTGEIAIEMKNQFDLGSIVEANITNNTDKTAIIKNECPQEPLNVLEYTNNQWTPKIIIADIKCDGSSDTEIAPGGKATIAYSSWNHSLFREFGRYKISATVTLKDANNQTEQKTVESPEFQIQPEGWFSIFWTKIFYQPVYNVLFLIIKAMPGNDLGLAILLLTIIIRTILLIPSQKALKSQRKLQEVQPKLKHIREKHKDDQEAIARETMAIWKEHKVNPFGSCLPLVIQIPVLIALFYVVRDGLNPDNAYLLYNGLQNFSFNSIQVNFLNILDLTKVNYYVLPLIVGVLQFLQMKLAIVKTATPKVKNKEVQKEIKKEKNEMDMVNGSMTYIMPIMIAVFTAGVPAGVGLYWGTSTLYGIIQQLVINNQSKKEKASVKVIEKN